MKARLIVASLAGALVTALPSDSVSALQNGRSTAPREARIQAGKASLYAPEIGRGQPLIALHGGPDFDHGYLLPDVDRLSDAFRLIYYDQRGRGKSAGPVQPEDVTLYKEGDPEAVAARYRIHFKPAVMRPEDYEKLMATMKAGFISQGKAGIVKARAVEDRLMRDTWQVDGYDLLPKLRSLNIPTLVISSDHDFIPPEIAAHIAAAIPNARLVTIKNCGHFAYLECAGDVRRAFNDFFRSTPASGRPR